MATAQLLRPFWRRLFGTDFRFIVIAFLVLGLVRIAGLIQGEIYVVVAGFLLMWVMPGIFFHRAGRRQIGIRKPKSWLWMVLSFVMGVVAAAIIYWLGFLLYGTGIENWGITVVGEYFAQEQVIIPVVFAVVTLFSMLFSPIGEELFFRGMIYEVVARRFSSRRLSSRRLSGSQLAALWSSLAFALIHIPHHDIVFAHRAFTSIFVPLFLWVMLMFAVCYLFVFARRKSGSIWGAIVCHAGYILGMNLFVYFVLLDLV